MRGSFSFISFSRYWLLLSIPLTFNYASEEVRNSLERQPFIARCSKYANIRLRLPAKVLFSSGRQGWWYGQLLGKGRESWGLLKCTVYSPPQEPPCAGTCLYMLSRWWDWSSSHSALLTVTLALLICAMNLQTPVLYLLMPNILFSEVIRPFTRLSNVYLILYWWQDTFSTPHLFKSFTVMSVVFTCQWPGPTAWRRRSYRWKGRQAVPAICLQSHRFKLVCNTSASNNQDQLTLHNHRSCPIPAHLPKTA